MPEEIPVVALSDVSVRRAGRPLIDRVNWEIRDGERWAVLGPNGSGKTTLLQVVGARLHPSSGDARILGERLGRVDVRTLRARVALVSASELRQLRPELSAREVVVTGKYAALEPWWRRYTSEEWESADLLLGEAGLGDAAGQPLGVLSEGERQQVLLCRALMARPELVLLDEPAAGLDVGARERFVARLGSLADDPDSPPLVLVTHHVEEIPKAFTHAALLQSGRVVTAGPIDGVLTSSAVSTCFGSPVTVGSESGRWWARAAL